MRRCEFETDRVDAVALTARLTRAIIKHMAQMRSAALTAYARTNHAVTGVLLQYYVLTVGRLSETRPAATAVKLSVTRKKYLTTVFAHK